MSLFKTRDVWTAVVGESENFDVGCICLADVDNSGSDKIIVGSYSGCLRVYNPLVLNEDANIDRDNEMKPSDLLCEVVLPDPIIQIEAGRFVSGSEKLAILVLHSKSFATYFFTNQEGSGDALFQCNLSVIYEHKLKRNAFNLCFGTFGGIKGRDHICVQSMDGALSIFEQEVFAFSRFLPDSLIPGPLKYLASTDCFVTGSSCRRVECYKLQTLALSAEVATKSHEVSGRKVIAEWTFSIDDNAKDISTINSHLAAKIFVLGERNLYALSGQGQLIFMNKFEFEPTSFYVYNTTETCEISNMMISTHSRTLLICGNTTTLWAAQLNNTPVQILRANFGKYKGLIVTLDDEGHLSCCYLGTNPTVFSRKTIEDREINYAEAKKELKELQVIIKEKQNVTGTVIPSRTPKNNSSDIAKMTLNVLKFERYDDSVDSDVEESDGLPSITLNVMLQSKLDIKDVRISITAGSSISATPSTLAVNHIDSNHSIENHVKIFMKYQYLPTSLLIQVTTTFQTQQGIMQVIKQSLKLPLALIMKTCQPERNATYKLTINSNKPPIHLKHLYQDCISNDGDSDNVGSAIAFKYFGSQQHSISLLASGSSSKYRIQSDYFPGLWLVLDDFVDRLKKHSPDVRLDFNKQEVPMQEFFEVIDRHFHTRMEKRKVEKLLEESAIQFRAVQKRLLVICKDKTPASFINLDILLTMIHKQTINLASQIESINDDLMTISAELSNVISLIIYLLQLSCDLNREEVDTLTSALTLDVETMDGSHGWEELVDCSITHLLRTFLSKNVKDTMINQTLSQLEDVGKLKRHIQVLYDKLCTGFRLAYNGGNELKDDGTQEQPMVGGKLVDFSNIGIHRDSRHQFNKRTLERLNEETVEMGGDDDDVNDEVDDDVNDGGDDVNGEADDDVNDGGDDVGDGDDVN